jgi:lipoprotein-releasing system permease protein
MKLVAIILSIFLITGTLLPGLQIGSLITTEGIILDGIFVLMNGILVLVLSVYDKIRKEWRFGKTIIACSISCLSVATYDLVKVYSGTNNITEEIAKLKLLVGLYFIIAAAIGLLVIGIFQLKRIDKAKVYQGGVAAFIANRIAFNKSTGSGGQRSFSRFIIRLSIVATVISVAVMIITLAFANGFQATVSQKVFSFLGHIHVQEKQPFKAIIAEESPLIKNDTLANEIKKNPEVESIHPFSTKYAMLKTQDEIEGVLVKGLDSTYDFGHILRFIQEGRPIHFNDSSYSREIMLSAYTAQQLKIKVNDRILIYFIRPGSGSSEGKIRPDKLTVTGIYKTGIEDYDRTFAIADLRLIQRLDADTANPNWKNEIGGYEIFLKDYKKIDKVANEIYNIPDFPPTWDTQSVKNISPNIFDWLNMQDVTRNVLIGFMIIVAVINLITCLIILVLERVRMVGILKSLGATDWTVQKIFLRHSVIITITGIIIGAAIAIGFLYLQKETGFIKLKEEAYYLSEAAVKIVWWQVAAICIGTLVVCFFVLMIPSILVRKIQPVKAIHFR